MKTFLDTNVIIAACIEEHEHHDRALELLERVLGGTDHGVISAHALAEAYAVMTRLPKPLRVAPGMAASLLEKNYLNTFEVVALTGKEYTQLLIRVSQAGWVGGLIYDAIHVTCAAKGAVDRLYSWNAHHLQTVAPEEFRARIVIP
jgi:predicted nucleic acid-binding protein